MPLTTIGVATTALVDAATVAAAAERGGAAIAAGETANIPRSLSQPIVSPPKDESPDAINPVSDPVQNPPESAPSPGPMIEITQHPTGDNPKLGHPTFIGNAAWITPGSLVSLGNTVWGKLQPQSYVSPGKGYDERDADIPPATHLRLSTQFSPMPPITSITRKTSHTQTTHI